MHTVELLEQALAAARETGYLVREEWLGNGGGSCLFKGQRCLFIDLALNPHERLDRVLAALAELDEPTILQFPTPLRGLLSLRKAA